MTTRNDLVLFCEYLIHQYYTEDDFSAYLTLSGIEHFIGTAKRAALKDHDMDDYENWAAISDNIRVMRDAGNARRTSRRIERRRGIIAGAHSDHLSGLYHGTHEDTRTL